MTKKMIYGSTAIEYEVVFSGRKTLGITVLPDGKVIVKAPVGVKMEAVEEKVYKRASWIARQQDYFRSFGEKKPQKRFVSGESHYYLGRQYMLRITEGKPNCAKYKGRYFEVVCTPSGKAKELMKAWYRERAKIKFTEIAEPIIQRFKLLGYTPSSLHIQEMRHRWGSCTSTGKIILNTELVKAPVPCIQYVVTHELCHLVHRDHTAAFFDLLTTEMPDWQRWKNKLECFMQSF